jgi:molybdopterin synthase sulfur carrier subunit
VPSAPHLQRHCRVSRVVPVPDVEVTITVPSLLERTTGGQRAVVISAGTLRESLETLVEQYPLLKVHLYDESGALRQHVNVFYNEQNTKWLESLDVRLRPGDTVTVLQAVSGG